VTLREALEALYRAGRIAHMTRRGMTFHAGASYSYIATSEREYPPTGTEPDTSDPATVGYLAALAREASGDAYMYADVDFPRGGPRWLVHDSDGRCWAAGPTKGGAWAAALVALAQEQT
jgi:hypothetical protein